MRGSDFAELRAFATVAEQGNFTRAAARLGVSPSALSQTLKLLEQRLGVRLLNRTTRSVAPSQAGARLLARLRPLLCELDSAVAEVSSLRDTPSGLLRINSTRIAAVHFLAPLIAPFLKAYPDITLELIADDRLVDIVAHQFDAGVRLGEMVEKDMIAVRVGGELRMNVVGSPGYFKEFGTPRTPRDLQHHRCINFRRPSRDGLYRWEFERGADELEAAVEGPLIVNEPQIALIAARGGAGLAYIFDHEASAEIESGKLVHVLKDWSPPFPGFYLYYPSRHISPALRAFVDFLNRRRR